MSESRSVSVNGSGGFLLGLLGIAFIILKLTGVIAWSWWWVLAPFWVPVAFTITALVVFLIAVGCMGRNPFRRRSKNFRDLDI